MPSPTVTPGFKLTPPPVPPGQPQDTSGASDAIQTLGLNQFPNIYVGGVRNPDGSIVVQLGPGDTTVFTNALHTLLASPKIAVLGSVPKVTIVRVPHNPADFDATLAAFLAALPRLKTQGFVPAHSEPNIPAGMYNVAFSAAPSGMTIAGATTELQKTVSPLIWVTSVDASPIQLAADRGHDLPSFNGSDLLHAFPPGWLNFCTAGFTIVGTAGKPRGSTAAHCNEHATGNLTWYNGNYFVNGYDPAPGSGTPDNPPTLERTFGTTSNWQYTDSGADIQLLDTTGDPYAAYIWVGKGMSAPTPMAVGAPFTSRPMVGDSLTFDGAFSREHRWMAVTSSNSTVCTYDSYYPNEHICHSIQTNLYMSYPGPGLWPGPGVQQGDSGGPVFCYACYSNGTAKPAGLIESFENDAQGQYAYATFIQTDLGAIGGGAHIYTYNSP